MITALNARLAFAAGLAVIGCGSSATDPESVDAPWPPDSSEDLALTLDGTNDYATMGLAGFPPTGGAQTLSMFVKPEGGGGVQALLVLRLDFEHGIEIGFQDDLPTAWRVFGGTIFVAGATLNDGEWHHLAYVTSGGDPAAHWLYIDGAEVARGMATPSKRTPTTAWLGSIDGASQFYRGQIDDIRVWDGARTAEEIAAEAAGDVPNQHPSLRAYWTCNEISGPRVADRSGRGNHMILGDGIRAFMPGRVMRIP